ncbi:MULTISPECIES: branched-chain amino acid transport system II carrier protein [Peptostreptococcales]|uniref:branched-chain amino acid transport system II carrier protein n=1 Tax=Peptostreptococcales TaxID=3082720 RepID=UPI000E4CAE7C|nr:branched-chain amino acid transport system II carrier protein [Peptoclostridium sp. AF21-18]RHQ99886.1 branched-chain amino acid transport system II carrier protein [Peptoclostridium sp. AF21-18]
MNKKTTDIFVVGFALFSIFFGAGNLLFPPYLGLVSGQDWFISFLGFIIGDAGLALLVIVVAAKNKGILDEILVRGGKKLARFIGCAAILCIGPFLAIPRTAATTFEMSILPFMPNLGTAGSVIFSIIFFVATYFLTIKSTKVLDIIGKFLTPVLLLSLLALIIKGVITPIGPMSPDHMIDRSLFSEGLSQGYLTMDALGASAMAGIMISTLVSKGYTDTKDQISMTIKAGFVSGIALSIVYGGLCYLGATMSTMHDINISQALLVVAATEGIFGTPGKVLLAIMVLFACLTTSIGLTSSAGRYFEDTTDGRLSYEKIVTAICIFSAVVSTFGVNKIIQISIPILQTIYPVMIILVVLTIFTKQIKNDNTFKGAAYFTFVASILSVANSLTGAFEFINVLPLTSLGLGWIVPGLIGAVVGSFIKTKGSIQNV